MAKNLLPIMVSVSRNSRLTQELEAILNDKLSEADIHILELWLRTVKEEKQIVNNINFRINLKNLHR